MSMIRVKLFIAEENITDIPKYRRILNRDKIQLCSPDTDCIHIYVNEFKEVKLLKKKYDWIQMYMRSTEPIVIVYPSPISNRHKQIIDNQNIRIAKY